MVTDVYYELIDKYEGYESLGFVVMPDHVHFVVLITRADIESAPTEIPKFVQEFKRYTTIKYITRCRGAPMCASRWVTMIEKWIHKIPQTFKNVKIDYYVIMPDHVHLILFMCNERDAHMGVQYVRYREVRQGKLAPT